MGVPAQTHEENKYVYNEFNKSNYKNNAIKYSKIREIEIYLIPTYFLFAFISDV